MKHIDTSATEPRPPAESIAHLMICPPAPKSPPKMQPPENAEQDIDTCTSQPNAFTFEDF